MRSTRAGRAARARPDLPKPRAREPPRPLGRARRSCAWCERRRRRPRYAKRRSKQGEIAALIRARPALQSRCRSRPVQRGGGSARRFTQESGARGSFSSCEVLFGTCAHVVVRADEALAVVIWRGVRRAHRLRARARRTPCVRPPLPRCAARSPRSRAWPCAGRVVRGAQACPRASRRRMTWRSWTRTRGARTRRTPTSPRSPPPTRTSARARSRAMWAATRASARRRPTRRRWS